MSNLIPASEAARRLKITRRQVSRLVHEEKLEPATKAPGRNGAFMFDPAVVDRLAEERAS